MSKKKASTPTAKPKTKPATSPKASGTSNKVKEAKETKKFFVVFAIATLLLVAFLYFIMKRVG
jgi:hypothetical protein